MAFDIKSARPISSTGFDINTAKPVSSIPMSKQIVGSMKRVPEQIFGSPESMFAKLREGISPVDMITGRAPSQAMQNVYTGIKDIAIPQRKDSSFIKTATDIALAPETYMGGILLPKAISKTGQAVRSFVGIPSKTVKWLKERGAKKIFTPEKESVDYIKTYLAPEAHQVYESGTIKIMEEEGKAMGKALSSVKDKFISMPKTFENIRKILRGYNLIDSTGRLTKSISEREVPSAIKMLGDMYKQVEGMSYKGAEKVIMPKGFFQFYRKALRVSQKGAGEFKKDVQTVIDGLYDDIEKAGATGIGKAKELYKNAIQLEQEFGMSYEAFANKLQSAVNPQNWKFLRERLRPLLRDKTDDIFNNIKDHLTAQEFVGREKAPFTKIGVGTRLGKKMFKEYYEKNVPTPKPLLRKP
jgi:hypothetical protein